MSSRLKTLKSTDDDSNRQSPATSASTIPQLPDKVIEKILSFLPIKLAAQANTVAKQWAAIWPSFPVIDLDEASYSERDRFLDMLHFSVRRCKNQKVLEKLRIRTKLEDGFDEVNEWIEFAVERCVKELHIYDSGYRGYKFFCNDILCLKSLTCLRLEWVCLCASELANDHVNLPSLKSLYLKEVQIKDDFENAVISPLLAACPCIEHLSIICMSFFWNFNFEISSNSLKSLEILHCYVTEVTVSAKSLESFTYYSSDFEFFEGDDSLPSLKTLSLWECDNLKHVNVRSGLKRLLLHRCFKAMQNSFKTPRLKTFDFSGYLMTKVHFVEAPSSLLNATIRIRGDSWPLEYYSAMRDFLESFDCSQTVKLHIHDVECLIIPEECRMRWSPPLPSMKQLHLHFLAPLPPKWKDRKDLRSSMVWMAPSADRTDFLNINDNVYDDDSDEEEDSVINLHAGSKPFAVYMDDVRRDHPGVNPFVRTFETTYPHFEDDIARVGSAEESVMSAVAKETWPDTPDEHMSEAISRLDTSDPTIGARIMGTAFPERSNDYYCRGLGDVGAGMLKKTPGFQRRGGASSSNNVQTTQLRQLRSKIDAKLQYAAAIDEIINANNAAFRQWMIDFAVAQSQGLPPLPMSVPIPLPPMPQSSQSQPSPSSVDLDNVDFTFD